MGRGRAKAKQTRVARDLKYRPVDTDFESLQRELRGGSDDVEGPVPDQYADLAEDYDDDRYRPRDDDEAFDDDEDLETRR